MRFAAFRIRLVALRECSIHRCRVLSQGSKRYFFVCVCLFFPFISCSVNKINLSEIEIYIYIWKKRLYAEYSNVRPINNLNRTIRLFSVFSHCWFVIQTNVDSWLTRCKNHIKKQSSLQTIIKRHKSKTNQAASGFRSDFWPFNFLNMEKTLRCGGGTDGGGGECVRLKTPMIDLEFSSIHIKFNQHSNGPNQAGPFIRNRFSSRFQFLMHAQKLM